QFLRRRTMGKIRCALPHERTVAAARRKSAPSANSVSARRRKKFLRPPRDSRLHRLCELPRESRRRHKSAAHHQHARAGNQRDGGLRAFLDEVSLNQDREEKNEHDDKRGVTLITLHAAKGLEFPHVYLIGLEEGLLPHDRSKVEGTVDEERRLLYVGITRAMRTLTLTWCRSRMKFGSAMPCHASSFLKVLAPDLIEHIDFAKLINTAVAET